MRTPSATRQRPEAGLAGAQIVAVGSRNRDRAERFGLTESWLRAANNLAVVYEMTDRFEESLESGREMLRRSRRIGDRVWEAMSLTGELLPMILLGRWDAALEQFEVAADVGSAGGALTETMLLDVVELLVARVGARALEAEVLVAEIQELLVAAADLILQVEDLLVLLVERLA